MASMKQMQNDVAALKSAHSDEMSFAEWAIYTQLSNEETIALVDVFSENDEELIGAFYKKLYSRATKRKFETWKAECR